MDDQQVDILKTLYSQQQSTAHILREKISKITTGAIGTLVVVDGWILSRADVKLRAAYPTIASSTSVARSLLPSNLKDECAGPQMASLAIR